MVETGLIIPHWLLLVAIIIPLLTAILIFSRQPFKKEVLYVLLLLSLVLFTKNLLSWIFIINLNPLQSYFSLFDTVEFVLLLLLFRIPLQPTFLTQWINYLIVACISVVITLFCTQQNNHYMASVFLVETIIIDSFAITSQLMLIRNQYIFIFHSPIFWIAGGTFFYYSMILVSEILSYQGWLPKDQGGETKLLLSVFDGVRLLFYLAAVIIKQPKKQGEDWDHFKNSSQESRP